MTVDQGELLPTWLVDWKGGSAGAGTVCRVCKVCKAWSVFVQEICKGNTNSYQLQGVAYNSSDRGRVWAYYKTVYIVQEDRYTCQFVQSAGLDCKQQVQEANYSWSVGSGLVTQCSEAGSQR